MQIDWLVIEMTKTTKTWFLIAAVMMVLLVICSYLPDDYEPVRTACIETHLYVNHSATMVLCGEVTEL